VSPFRPVRRIPPLIRLAISTGVLIALAQALDVEAVAARLSDLHAPWVLLALALSIGQVLALSWRWRYTAGRLGIQLPMRTAIREYYLSLFLNQVLPGGVTGDVSRAWRHARMAVPTGQAIRAVILERATAQVVMSLVALISFLSLPIGPPRFRVGVALIFLLAGGTLGGVARRRRSACSLTGRLWADVHRAVLSRGALLIQLITSLVLVGSYIAVFLMAGRAVGVDAPLATLLPLVAPVLMAMLIPVSVAGWGVREGAAAGIWSVAGLPPEEGVAISVAYGVFALIGSAPGALVLTRALLSGPDRRARRPRGGSI
jgi:uncharacterized membrane protein YbhN (UPF0104 family)